MVQMVPNRAKHHKLSVTCYMRLPRFGPNFRVFTNRNYDDMSDHKSMKQKESQTASKNKNRI